VLIASGHSHQVISYRVHGNDGAAYHVQLPGDGAYETATISRPAYDENAVIVELDGSTLMMVYVDGDRVMRADLFDSDGNALGSSVVLGTDRGRPSLAATPGGVYLAWWEPSEVPHGVEGWDPVFEEPWLQKLSWDGAVLDATATPMPLPRDEWHGFGDQVVPSITAVPYWPSGALVAAWTDLVGGSYSGHAVHADVVIELIPTPVVRNPGGI
jgi:hypothetical protein